MNRQMMKISHTHIHQADHSLKAVFFCKEDDDHAHEVDKSLARHMFVGTADEDPCIDDDDKSFGGQVPVGDADVDEDGDAGPGSGRSICVRSVGSADKSHIEGSADEEHDVGSFEEGHDVGSFAGKSNVVGSDPSSSSTLRRQQQQRQTSQPTHT